MRETIVQVKRPRRSIGRQCMHCGRQATTTAVRKHYGHRLNVWYCDAHAEQIIGQGKTTEVSARH